MDLITPAIRATAERICDSPSELAALSTSAERVIRAVANRRHCPECEHDAGHTPECSHHYSRPTAPACYACAHGDYSLGAKHSGCVWGLDV